MSVKLLPKHVGWLAVLKNGELHEITGKGTMVFYTIAGCYNPDGTPFAPYWEEIGMYHVIDVIDPQRLLKAAETVVASLEIKDNGTAHCGYKEFVALKRALPKKGK